MPLLHAPTQKCLPPQGIVVCLTKGRVTIAAKMDTTKATKFRDEVGSFNVRLSNNKKIQSKLLQCMAIKFAVLIITWM